MNQISDNHGNTMDNQNTRTPEVIMPDANEAIESIEVTSEQIEANIDRLLAEELSAPTNTDLSFDATAYARLSSVEPPKPLDQPVGEADPYVNPEETTTGQNPNPVQPTSQTAESEAESAQSVPEPATVEEILSRLPDYEPEPVEPNLETIEPNDLGQVEAETAESLTADATLSNDANSNPPTVEVIETEVEDAESATSSADGTVDEPSPPVAWFANGATLKETPDEPANTPRESEATTPTPVPIASASPDTDEPIYDVRDFGESASGTLEPIPGSYEVDPDAFDFNTAEELPSPNPGNLTSEPEEVFMAGEGDVIQIDGNEGFDFIDLACFNVNTATFSDGLIRINDDQGSAFEIRHQNVKYALFESGVQVILTSDGNEG